MNQNSTLRFVHFLSLKFACILIIFTTPLIAQKTFTEHSSIGQKNVYLNDSYENAWNFPRSQPLENNDFIADDEFFGKENFAGYSQCGGFTTYTQGGWGAKPSGNNPGMYLKNNFTGAFPSGVTIGSASGYTIKFTTSQAIDDFLPSGSTAVVLTKNYVNPGRSYKNVLAGQLLAATLNVKFDLYDANFSSNTIKLGDLIIASGAFTGWTVNNFLTLANNALGGSSSEYNLSDINNTLDQINNNYDNGTVNNNFLNCPVTCNLNVTGNKTDASCYGSSNGSITLTVTGASGTATYLWNNGSTSKDRTGLPAGTYTVTVKDNANCTATYTATIAQPAAISITGVSTNVTTYNGSNGSISLTISGGTFPYTYSWSDGSKVKDRTGISAGSYTVTITDAKGCTASKQFTITAPVCNLSVSAQVNNVSCYSGNNGSITLNVAGANGSVTYLWNNGATVKDRTTLSAGTYSVTVTDNTNCSVSYSANITQPAALSIEGTANNVTTAGGNNGSIQLTVTGGTSPYSYSWNDGNISKDRSSIRAGNYSVAVTDSRGCTQTKQFIITEPVCNLSITSSTENVSCFGAADGSININAAGANGDIAFIWNDGITSEDRAALTAGTYTITLTDDADCSAAFSINITQPSALSIAGTVNNVTVINGDNGSIEITAEGGTTPYNYSWSDGKTSKDNSSLQAGNYSVSVTDAHGCNTTNEFTIVQPVCNLSISSQVNNISCNGANNGSINLTVTGATGNTQFLWNDNATTKDRDNLPAGTYTVTATDEANCTATINASVVQPDELIITGTANDVSTVAGNNGSIVLSVSGGTSPYGYSWSDGSSTQNREALAAGDFSVTITDANGCTAVEVFTIHEPGCSLGIDAQITHVSTFNATDGGIDVTVTNATGEISYEWGDGSTDEDRNNLAAGRYFLMVTDEANCVAYSSFTVRQPDELLVSGKVDDVSEIGAEDGSINITVTGGTGPYTYLWDDGSTDEDRTNLEEGSYSLTVTDARGGSITVTYQVTHPTKKLGTVSGGSTLSALQGNALSFGVKVSPNPTKEIVKLNVTSDISKTAIIHIYNLAGKLVFTGSLKLISGSNYKEINLGALSKGTYVLQVTRGTEIKTVKIIKE